MQLHNGAVEGGACLCLLHIPSIEDWMPSLDGFSVHVLCDGVPLEEYSTTVEDTGPLSAGCWITSEQNKVSLLYLWLNSYLSIPDICIGV